MSHKLKFRVDPEKFKSAGESFIFHVDILDPAQCVCGQESIPIRTDFYNRLKQSEKWPDCFFNIIRTRVMDRLRDKKKKTGVGIDELLALADREHEL